MSNFEIELAERIKGLPKYLFAKIDDMKKEALDKGMDIIDLGVGDPDLPTFEPIVKKLKEAVDNPENHRYPSYIGLLQFRQAVAAWYKKRFNVSLDPQNEVLSLIGSKEGIGHIHLAFINPGDIVLVPDPAYPVYKAGTILAGGTPYIMPLLKENGFLPDLSSIPKDIYEAAYLDGASYLTRLRTLTIPLLKPFVNIAIVLNVIYVFNSFPIIWILTEGGPSNSTDILPTYLYKMAFQYGEIGLAAAVSIIMLAILLSFTFVYAYFAMKEKK